MGDLEDGNQYWKYLLRLTNLYFSRYLAICGKTAKKRQRFGSHHCPCWFWTVQKLLGDLNNLNIGWHSTGWDKKNQNLCSRYTVSLSPIKIQHLTLCPVIKKRSKSKSKLFQNKNQCFGCWLGHLLLLTKQTWIFVYYCYFDSPFKFNSMGFSYMLSEATLANFSAFIAHFGL